MDEGQKLKREILEGVLREAKAPQAVIKMLIQLEDEVVRLKRRVTKLEGGARTESLSLNGPREAEMEEKHGRTPNQP